MNAPHNQQPPPKPSRKGKERDIFSQDGPQPTDLDEKLMALRRKQAGPSRLKEKSEREHPRTATQQQHHFQPLPQPQTLSPPRGDRSPKSSTPTTRSPVQQVHQRRHAAIPGAAPRASGDADYEGFSRLKITSSPAPTPRASSSRQRLYNPDTDPIPIRRTAEPEASSDADNSNAPRHLSSGRSNGTTAARQLFDHRKHDPVHFHQVIARPQQSQQSHSERPMPTPRSSGDYVSAGSTSSYAPSVSSSTFTLSSTTDASSASSNLFDNRPGHPATDDSNTNVFSQQLKKLYRQITDLETKIQQGESDETDEMDTRVVLKAKEANKDDLEREKWASKIEDHKKLSEIMHNLLQLSLAPSVPASLKNIPTKYNIIVRLWTHAFHKPLESLRRASFRSVLALELLQEFIYHAYTFYTGLVEDPILASFRNGWLEALGDLARYRMIVATMLDGGIGSSSGLTISAVKAVDEMTKELNKQKGLEVPISGTANGNSSGKKSISDFPEGRIASQPPSVGIAAARLLEVEPDKERWRNIARDWYATGLFEQPGTGKLHHHLGLLYREVEGEELRGVYHFVKSMTTLHPFMTSRESVLSIWSNTLQTRRVNPDARVSDLFVLLHGMLFTNIQLDDFQPALARFLERLVIEGAEEREWIMMAIINIASVLEYGKPSGLLRRMGAVGGRDSGGRIVAKKPTPGSVPEEPKMDIDEDQHSAMPTSSRTGTSTSPPLFSADAYTPDQPSAFKYALQLTFAMLTLVLRNPARRATTYARSSLNPYLSILLTFLATIIKHQPSLALLERSIPWDDLAAFFTAIPRRVMEGEGLFSIVGVTPEDRWTMLTTGCAPPLPEDWCMRGMEWVSRKVFERGYWKSGEDRPEVEVLDSLESSQVTDGQIEDDQEDLKGSHFDGVRVDGQTTAHANGPGAKNAGWRVGRKELTMKRWVRIVRSAVDMAGAVEGFTWVQGTREWRIEGKLAEKVAAWREMDRMEREEEERRRMGKRWVDDDDLMDVDEEGEEEEESEDDENDSEEVKELKARRRYLRRLLQSAQQELAAPSPSTRSRLRTRKNPDNYPELRIVPGYSILVIDTNILLSSLSVIISLVESLRWTIIIPLPVIMELDGLVNNPSQLGQAAQSAMEYIAAHLRTHSTSLKVQTSKGNFLTRLNVRTEEVDFTSGNIERSMDDLILKAAIWQDEHWMDRSAMLNAGSQDTNGAVKVVLLSLDRNLRLKARSRQLPAAGEKDLASLLVRPK